MKKYYEAYDKRYRQVHDNGLAWSIDKNTQMVENTIIKYNLENEKILEIGCGEGRDAKYLLSKNYNVLAVDISHEAIEYCKKNDIYHKDNYQVLDVLEEINTHMEYGFIYSVACLHMLVLDGDRDKFYKYIYNNLKKDGYALILSMGNGKEESESDITKAFDDVKRVHQETSREIKVASTSLRMVNFDTLFKEIMDNKFKIIEYGVTKISNHFDNIMYVLIKKI